VKENDKPTHDPDEEQELDTGIDLADPIKRGPDESLPGLDPMIVLPPD